MRFIKSALTLAVAMASTGAIAAAGSTIGTNVDGYDFSGHTARSQALQLDYFAGHKDSGDIFINPALVGQYGSRVEVNANNGNNEANGDGGVFVTTGPNTFGVYIGRDSAANFGKNINEMYKEIGVSLANDYDIESNNPTSQFDLFYGFDAEAFALGARLNYQANEQKKNHKAYTEVGDGFGSDFSSVDAFLKNNIANQMANNATTPNFTALPYTGTLTQTTVMEDNLGNPAFNSKYNADEINLSLGFSIKAINLDGAILLGQANGTFKTNAIDQEEIIEMTSPDGIVQDRRTTKQEGVAFSAKYELDKGTTLGFNLRSQVFKTEESKLTLSFAYINQDYGTKVSYNMYGYEKNYTNDVANTPINTETDSINSSGKLKDERNAYQLLGAFERSLDEATKLTVFSGLRYTEIKEGYELSVNSTVNRDVDHTSNDQFTDTYARPVGTMSSDSGKSEFTSIPLVIAVEHGFNERWTGRASVSRDLYRNYKDSWSDKEFNGMVVANAMLPPAATETNQSTESGPAQLAYTNSTGESSESNWVNQTTTAMVGVGYTRNNFTIDTVLGMEFFTKTVDNGVFGAVSLGYKF